MSTATAQKDLDCVRRFRIIVVLLRQPENCFTTTLWGCGLATVNSQLDLLLPLSLFN